MHIDLRADIIHSVCVCLSLYAWPGGTARVWSSGTRMIIFETIVYSQVSAWQGALCTAHHSHIPHHYPHPTPQHCVLYSTRLLGNTLNEQCCQLEVRPSTFQ